MSAGPEEMKVLASRILAAVAEGRYSEAQGTLQEYSRALRRTAESLPRGDSRLRGLEDEWQLLHQETWRRVLVRRAHVCAKLARLPKCPGLYRELSLPLYTWQCAG